MGIEGFADSSSYNRELQFLSTLLIEPNWGSHFGFAHLKYIRCICCSMYPFGKSSHVVTKDLLVNF